MQRRHLEAATSNVIRDSTEQRQLDTGGEGGRGGGGAEGEVHPAVEEPLLG